MGRDSELWLGGFLSYAGEACVGGSQYDKALESLLGDTRGSRGSVGGTPILSRTNSSFVQLRASFYFRKCLSLPEAQKAVFTRRDGSWYSILAERLKFCLGDCLFDSHLSHNFIRWCLHEQHRECNIICCKGYFYIMGNNLDAESTAQMLCRMILAGLLSSIYLLACWAQNALNPTQITPARSYLPA